MRTVVAAVSALAGIVVVALNARPAFIAFRARTAVVSACDDSLRTLSPGRWVRLQGCGVDMFHAALLDDPEGKRSHRLTPLRSQWGAATEPSTIALAIPTAPAADALAFSTTPRPDSSASKVADLRETMGVVWGQLGALPHRLVEVPDSTTRWLLTPPSSNCARRRK